MGLAPFKNQRIQGICAELKKASQSPNGWDAVMLQEVWSERDRRKLSRCGYPYKTDLNQSKLLVDSGLMLLSKHPLKQSKRLTFPVLPVGPDVLEDGEALAKKSANLVKMVHPQAGEIWLANTHLVSYYAEGEQDKYKPIRKKQFIQFAKWVSSIVQEMPVIVGGDWNFGIHEPDLWSARSGISTRL
jgi:exonuclease III